MFSYSWCTSIDIDMHANPIFRSEIQFHIRIATAKQNDISFPFQRKIKTCYSMHWTLFHSSFMHTHVALYTCQFCWTSVPPAAYDIQQIHVTFAIFTRYILGRFSFLWILFAISFSIFIREYHVWHCKVFQSIEKDVKQRYTNRNTWSKYNFSSI